jgi:C4-dicarboxylate-specific signal transduction histidine kinase
MDHRPLRWFPGLTCKARRRLRATCFQVERAMATDSRSSAPAVAAESTTPRTAHGRPKGAEEALRELETELAHMNRVSMMGELAASLAHEIAQPIASARNNARAAVNFLDQQPSDLGEAREALTCVVADVDRARDIIDRIREHIKKAPPRKERFELNQVIDEVMLLTRSAMIRNESRSTLASRAACFPSRGIAFNCNRSS